MFASIQKLLGRLSGRRRPVAAPAPRRRPQPRLEVLEDRAVPACLTIGGSVYEDLNNNGIREAGEVGIANNPVQLRDAATGEVVATAQTNAQGFYEFSVDERVSTDLQTITRSGSFASAKTNGTRTLEVDKFDSSLGTLESVEIVIDGQLVGRVRVENLEDSASTVDVEQKGTFTIAGPGGTLLKLTLTNEQSALLGAYDGSMDFGGASGKDFGDKTATGAKTITLNGQEVDLSAFVGSGKVTFTATGDMKNCICGPGNYVSNASSTASGNIQIRYNYRANNCLQPGQYIVRQLEQPTGYLTAKNTNTNTAPLPNSVGSFEIPVVLTNSNSTQNHFGEVRPASVSGYVWHDVNDNGIKEAGEPGIGGTTVRLRAPNGAEQIALTDSNGFYQFTGLRPKQYTIIEEQPAGFLDGKEQLGSLGGTAGQDQFFIQLASNQHGMNYNFGEVLADRPPVRPPVTPPPPDTPPDRPPATPTPPVSKQMFLGSSIWDYFLQS